ncbi:DNA alkylation repair protein [Carboxylicivirga marina]|uniref:DNA alkylation repair protein n=1 Tax=Carboxylicivirga marina TaxID=2800988 RepID=UPI0025983E53|nr:DNA alkylation repair protein [uncultured Carboxylicivirga sp.]
MTVQEKAKEIHAQLSKEGTKLGDLRKIAKEIKKDHDLAMELWSFGAFFSQQLAILIMDKKLLTQDVIEQLSEDIEQHNLSHRTHLADWLMANQLVKDKKTIALLESWGDSSFAIQRRLYWYYQGRLRWTGKTAYENTETLLNNIENKLAGEVPEVQWAMNFTAAWIGIFDVEYRPRCIALGEKLGLYIEEKPSKGCTPNYLPEFIRIEVEKRNK